MEFIKDLKFNEQGLIPAIAQDVVSNEVLMCAYMNEESIKKTIETGKATYFSRSRQELWEKGETSGHFQYVKEILVDCDGDAIVLKVEQEGAACHTDNPSCFYRKLVDGKLVEIPTGLGRNPQILYNVYNLIVDRVKNPKEGSYTNYLFEKGMDKILKKVGEECTEVIIGGSKQDKEETVYEIADLCYHVMVLMVQMGITVEDITRELEKRHVVDHKVKQERMQ